MRKTYRKEGAERAEGILRRKKLKSDLVNEKLKMRMEI